MKTLIAITVALTSTAALHAATNYVDCTLKDYSGHDGMSWEQAFQTIQEGVDAAAPGDVVLVAPGVYDCGGRTDELTDGGASNRVVIGKGIHLKSRDGAAATFIVGARGSGSRGLGDDACRCIASTQGKAETTIEGFTLTGGATPDGNNQAKTCGGAVWAYKTAPTYIVDCIVSNNIATRGGGIWGGTAIRTRFCNNEATIAGVSLRSGNAFNCIFTESKTASSQAAVDSVLNAVNCTFAGCKYAIVSESSFDNDFRNCLFVACQTLFNGSKQTKPVFRDCVAEIGSASAVDAKSENFVNGATPQTMNPIAGDFRFIAGGACDGTGDSAHLEQGFIPERFRETDFGGAPRIVGGNISIGAIEQSATPAGGCCVFDFNPDRGGVSVGGIALSSPALYAYAESWPRQVRMVCEPNAGQTVWGVSQGGAWGGYRYPVDNAIYVTFPAAGATITNYPYYTDKIVWVSPHGNDGYSGNDLGSQDHPFGTLQAAVDAVASVDRGIVYAMEGTYEKGLAYGQSATNRVYISSQVRLLAVGDREKTVIRGVRDESEDTGCGKASVRCAGADKNKNCQIAGFTLTGGFADGNSTFGGGAFMGGDQSVVYDCVISNCASPRAAAAWGGWLQRCLITGNTTVDKGNSTCRNGWATGCIFRGNASYSHLLGYGQTCYNCTIVSDGRQVNEVGASFYNCLIRSASKLIAPTSESQFAGLVVSNVTTIGAKSGYILADQKFVNIGSYDYRLRADSPAYGKGSVNVPNFAAYAIADYEGAPLFFVDGVPTPGAIQRPVAVVRMNAANSGEISPTGVQTVGAGESLVVTGSATARNLLGFEVDGVFHAAQGARSITLPYAELSALGGVAVGAVYAKDWYVSPDPLVGNDANTGWSADSPKLTLVGVMANVVSGDVVHAAAGVYQSREDVSKSHYTKSGDACASIRSRVVVPAGVALIGAGRADTVIEGRLGDDCGNAYGLGTNGVRCAYLEKGARLSGFTLRNGRTAPKEAGDWQDDNYMGGGVCGVDYKTVVVEDCTITNCVSVRGGAGYKVTFRNCVIKENRGTATGAAGRNCTHVNCLVAGNFGTDPLSAWYDLVNVTFASDNDKHIGGPTSKANNGTGIVLNSIFFPAKDGGAHGSALAMTNVALVGGATMTASTAGAMSNVVEFADAAAAGIGVDFSLLTDSPLVDAGDRQAYAALGGVATDVDGGQRIYNGAIDFGCREFDWRQLFAEALGEGFAVARASEDVVLDSGCVRLVGNSELTARWQYPRPGHQHKFSAQVAGDGKLTLFRNDDPEPAGEWTEATSGKTISWRDGEAESCEMAFSFSTAADGAYATLVKTEDMRGMLLLVR